jgi:gluconolactonase
MPIAAARRSIPYSKVSLTNVAFGGVDRKTIYCTESVSGSILRADLDIAGLPVHRGQP